ncbi:MAG: transcription-repair coupling factor [Candidatus Omnitrophica bacterium]|nr:transcription-repair coupling factor [Candidatus Omnitrophota bacterium]
MIRLLSLKAGQTLEKEELIRSLFELNYTKDQYVTRPGEFAERGAFVDIYPAGFRSPIRVSFHIDKIESIRNFSAKSGELMDSFNELTVVPVAETIKRRATVAESRLAGQDVLTSFSELEAGDHVVHLEYGIGRFLGYKRLKIEGNWRRHIAIEYADREILYVDEVGAKLLERYIGVEGKRPRLTKLNTKEWSRAKERARLAVHSVARDLIKLEAKRSSLPGTAFSPDKEWQLQFEKEFPYPETPDQTSATKEVKEDMERPHPMDRLLCGDVGYGKTEVAMRAAFKAVMDNKQVAFLVPTTILAEQHYITLSERVKNFPVRVEALSRFKTKKEQEAIVSGIRAGQVDVVIGTHRLLSRDIAFKDLGLVIIDEEQRFGVRHKERLKMLRELVDVLTLTATPIPRTLYLSLLGAREISMINTPPLGRMPVETHLIDFDDHTIREAFERETKRKGQIYFVHNRVQSIEKVYSKLKGLLPGVRFGVAHGQLPAHELEKVMFDFIKGNIDCLVATNIIESGLDIPNVNTLFVNRADYFGLADLYQLRGRVGRFSRKAYAYFIVPEDYPLTQDAEKRLSAIQRFTDLGSGFRIAMEDLEIRGAGNILGEEQSGFIYQVGFDLYCRMLHTAIDEEKAVARN